ncbi:subtilisin-like protein [Colletotrichum scovillei]|uniref:Subtilisin-like protein n=1 Tax=Colletotrichum scovillei TaxID=1209932 RepID=A0A9P7RBX8_9PEZI|nr:subtilisin-like protein [Colletotrichum scovillei]KAG7073975.1 subtilisin-like protein [Colletotrichum scovillei]KAG7081282.1 subtilisin-like protein [Colletotrichum scovillei]
MHSTAASREHWRDAEKMVVVIMVMLDQLPGKYHSLSAEVRDRWESSLSKLEHILSWVLVEDRDKLEEHAHFIGQNLEEMVYFLREEEYSSIEEIPNPIEDWLQQFKVANRQLGPAEDHSRVKVAILDTGCNFNNSVIQGSEGLHRLLGWSDSLMESAYMVDEDPGQRGTLLAALLFRLLPEASIFIVRVAKYSQDLPKARIDTAAAIRYAVKNWSVDIFVMAFGFEGPGESVESAIYEAERLKQDKVLFFAAANNNKNTVHELLPSRYNSVISVHGALHDGTFIPACNPQRHGKGLLRNIYGTLGQVRFGPGQPTLWGCSVATTIMAAIAACTLQFMAQRKESLGHLHTIMGTRDWILSLFDIMTRGQDERRERLRRFIEYFVNWSNDQGRSQAIYGFDKELKKPIFIVAGLKVAKSLTLTRKADGFDIGGMRSSKDTIAPQFQPANDLGDDKYTFCQICHRVWLQDGLYCAFCGCDATDIILPENDPRMLSRISLTSIIKPASSVKLESNARKFRPGHRPQLDRPVSYGDVVIAYSLRKITTRKVDDRVVFDHEHFPPDNSFNLSDWEWKI